MEPISGGLRSKCRETVGKERHWGRSFLKKFNVTSCARVDSCGRSAMATASKTKAHKIERKEEEEEEEDQVVVETEKVEDREAHVVTEQEHAIAVTKAPAIDLDVVVLEKPNDSPMRREIEDGQMGPISTTVEVVTNIGQQRRPMTGSGKIQLAADVGEEVVNDQALTTGGQEPDPSDASTASAAAVAVSAAIGEEEIGGPSVNIEDDVSRREIAAATRIQAAFRGHLARRAFRALSGLVKLQALARGSYVRRQAHVATTCMQALVRLQVRVRDRQQKQQTPRSKAGDP